MLLALAKNPAATPTACHFESSLLMLRWPKANNPNSKYAGHRMKKKIDQYRKLDHGYFFPGICCRHFYFIEIKLKKKKKKKTGMKILSIQDNQQTTEKADGKSSLAVDSKNSSLV